MSASRDDQIAWLRAIIAYTGMSAHQLALKAGINSSTLHRPLNDPNSTGMLSGRTVAALAEAAGVNPMEFPGRSRGLNEPDAQPFEFANHHELDAADNFNRAVRELCSGRNGRDPWIMRSYVLELEGILPGDVMVVDLNSQPRPNDIVCAQLYDWSGTKTETVFRVFNPPYLMTHSLRAGRDKPAVVDGTNVIIKGVVENILRSRI